MMTFTLASLTAEKMVLAVPGTPTMPVPCSHKATNVEKCGDTGLDSTDDGAGSTAIPTMPVPCSPKVTKVKEL